MPANERLRSALRAAGMTAQDLAERLDVDPKTATRWVTQGRTPYPKYRAQIAAIVDQDESQLWAKEAEGLDLTGDWWSGWQTFRHGVEHLACQPVRFRQDGDTIEIAAMARGLTEEQGGGYLWKGELRLWDNDILMGWYTATDGPVRSKGTLYFVLHPHGLPLLGRWVGLSHDGKIVTGWAATARTEDELPALVDSLKATGEKGPPL